ncbi:hypothetical protein N7471_009537 [Penicillium samsonianum]|uniref:uncharacterized protein n=1 Tax=Penicillium samsonianum TaxID=1882272 RepID=UPI0025473B42|nr:uncharacterized protein N7471_009537 [Penicillium samsonianum]KAJ6128320.1 hypothetical protein N7471_009537 [Penicillium samsonianum]
MESKPESEGKRKPRIDRNRNPIDAEVETGGLPEKKICRYIQCVLLNAQNQQLGVWTGLVQCIKLDFLLIMDPQKPQIDVRISIKWTDEENQHSDGPTNLKFHIPADQIKNIKCWAIVAPNENQNTDPMPFEIAANTASEKNGIVAFKEFLQMDFGPQENNNVYSLIQAKKLHVLTVEMHSSDYYDERDDRISTGLFNDTVIRGSDRDVPTNP